MFFLHSSARLCNILILPQAQQIKSWSPISCFGPLWAAVAPGDWRALEFWSDWSPLLPELVLEFAHLVGHLTAGLVIWGICSDCVCRPSELLSPLGLMLFTSWIRTGSTVNWRCLLYKTCPGAHFSRVLPEYPCNCEKSVLFVELLCLGVSNRVSESDPLLVWLHLGESYILSSSTVLRPCLIRIAKHRETLRDICFSENENWKG